MGAQTLDEMTWVQRLDEIGARLDAVDRDIKGQNEWHAEVDRSIKDLTCSFDRLTATMQNVPEKKVQAQFSKRKHVASVVNMAAMESFVLEDWMTQHLPVRPTGSQGDSFGPISRSRSMQSVVPKPPSGEMPEVPGVLEDESKAVGQMQESTEKKGDKLKQVNQPELQSFEVTEAGQVQDDQVQKKQKRTTTCSTAKLNQMNEESQVNILGSVSQGNESTSVDSGSKFIIALPSCISVALGIPVLCQCALAVACGCLECPSDGGLRASVIESIVYGIAAALCLLGMKKALFSSNLKLAMGCLHSFVDESFEVNWSEVSRREGCKYVMVWLLMLWVMIFARFWGMARRLNPTNVPLDPIHEVLLDAMEIVSVLVYMLSSGMIMAAAYSQSHLLLGLDKSLDCWCARLMADPDFELGVQSWNVLQALLKSVGRELAGSFLILQAFGSVCFISFLVSAAALIFQESSDAVAVSVEFLSQVPLLFMWLLSLRVAAHGAALTEKCRGIPPFVNQMPGELIDHQRQYLVRFVTDSSAGFCVRDVKLTQEMVMKQIYIVGALLSATFSGLSRIFA